MFKDKKDCFAYQLFHQALVFKLYTLLLYKLFRAIALTFGFLCSVLHMEQSRLFPYSPITTHPILFVAVAGIQQLTRSQM